VFLTTMYFGGVNRNTMYYYLTQENLGKPYQRSDDGGIVNYSVLNEIDEHFTCRHFAIKYVSRGKESYTIDDQKFDLMDGQVLLANAHHGGSIYIDQPLGAKGICIDIPSKVLDEVSGNSHFSASNFPVFSNLGGRSKTMEILSILDRSFTHDPEGSYVFDKDFYFELAQCIVDDTSQILHNFRSLHLVKSDTRKNILNRILEANRYIETEFLAISSIDEIAKRCSISEYYFYRLYKQVYQVSPYRKIQDMRMGWAKEQLSNGCSVTEVSEKLGYAEIASFSKLFKKWNGWSPSYYKI
jgi:AraC family transcriptional regulator